MSALIAQKKAWENRYKLMQQWKRAAEGAKSDKRANNMWWTRWLNVGVPPCL
jgi:hypothetical protein